MSHSHVPEGWPVLVPRIVTDDVVGLASFLREVFAVTGDTLAGRPTELRFPGPGDSLVMLSDPIARERHRAFLYVYVEDADATFARAVERGATAIEPPTDMPYGDRRAMVQDDPWGNTWQIATHGGRFTP